MTDQIVPSKTLSPKTNNVSIVFMIYSNKMLLIVFLFKRDQHIYKNAEAA